MKKYIIFILLTLVANVTIAQIDSTNVENITEVERIVDKYATKAGDAIIMMVSKLEGPAEKVFIIVTKLQIAKALSRLIPAFILMLFGIILIIKKYNYIIDIESWDEPFAFFLLCPGIGGGIWFLVALSVNLPLLVVPEWYAILELIELVK